MLTITNYIINPEIAYTLNVELAINPVLTGVKLENSRLILTITDRHGKTSEYLSRFPNSNILVQNFNDHLMRLEKWIETGRP